MARDVNKARVNAAKTFREMANKKFDRADKAAYKGNFKEAEKLREHGNSLRNNAVNASKNIGK